MSSSSRAVELAMILVNKKWSAFAKAFNGYNLTLDEMKTISSILSEKRLELTADNIDEIFEDIVHGDKQSNFVFFIYILAKNQGGGGSNPEVDAFLKKIGSFEVELTDYVKNLLTSTSDLE